MPFDDYNFNYVYIIFLIIFLIIFFYCLLFVYSSIKNKVDKKYGLFFGVFLICFAIFIFPLLSSLNDAIAIIKIVDDKKEDFENFKSFFNLFKYFFPLFIVSLGVNYISNITTYKENDKIINKECNFSEEIKEKLIRMEKKNYIFQVIIIILLGVLIIKSF